METSGNETLVLNAVQAAQGETGNFVPDHEVVASTKMHLKDARDSMEIQGGGDLLEIARTTEGLLVSLTAKGRQRLSVSQWHTFRAATNPGPSPVTMPVVSLRVEFSESNNCIVTSSLDFKDGRGSRERTYVRLYLSTDNHNLAKNCRVVLDRI